MKNIVAAISIFLMSVVIWSCKKNPDFTGTTKSIELPANGASVIEANNKFAFSFFHQILLTDDDNNNKLISPLSIYMALSMVYNGADNATKDSIAKAMQLSGIDINTLNSVCKILITALPAEDSRVKLDIANSIWYKQGNYNPLPSFLDMAQDNFGAFIQSLNFSDPQSVNTINNWVAQKTDDKIPAIIDNISPNELMFLINAIYFKGSWKYAFNTADTYNDIFHLQNGTTKSVPFMSQKITTEFLKNELFSIAELPYGGGNSFSMYVLQPTDPQLSVKAFGSSLNAEMLDDAINKMDSVAVKIKIPKWEYSYSVKDMKPELTALGMGLAFSDNADFSKIYGTSANNTFITRAVHKTYIKVNEEGTEAAAATAIGVGTTGADLSHLIQLDHPFLYVILEKQTGAVLFLGTVDDPQP